MRSSSYLSLPVLALVLASTLGACADAPHEAGPLLSSIVASPLSAEELPSQGMLDLGTPTIAVLTEDTPALAFDFEVPTRGDVRLVTAPMDAPNRAIDTELSLYAYPSKPHEQMRRLASNDDARDTPFSEIETTLAPGLYRVVVSSKGAAGAVVLGFDCPSCVGPRRCIFGRTFSMVRRGLSVRVERERLVDSVSQLSAKEKEQLVDALGQSAHEVTTPEEALAAVDANEVNVLELWDETNARPFIAFEYGAGDNSFGRIYPPGSLHAAAAIHDGDIVSCVVGRGKGGRTCRANAECGGGHRCAGISPATGNGICAPTTRSFSGAGESCTAEDARACRAGLVCGGLSRGDEGLCQPAWMRRTFDDWHGVRVPDGDEAGISRVIDAHGLATVDVDVELSVVVRHSRPNDLRVTLTNPGGTEVEVWDGARTSLSDVSGPDFVFDGPVRGFSGDESVNGSWTLKVVDSAKGASGALERWSLRVTSRWD